MMNDLMRAAGVLTVAPHRSAWLVRNTEQAAGAW
jgi:hypothetical protein